MLRVGIAGYGVVGKRRRQYIDKHPNLKTVAICDRYFIKNDHFENNPKDDVSVHVDYKSLLEKNDLDILFVCLTNDIAPEVTIAGLNKGVHVFCEKPPGRNIQDIVNVIETQKQYPNLKLKYGFNHRYHESVQETKRIIDTKELGEVINLRGVYGKSMIISYESTWRSDRKIAGGGILLDQGIHMVDLIRYFGGEFDEIKSFVSNDFWKYDVEDNAYAIMRSSKTGNIAILHSTATEWRHRFKLTISFTKGSLILEGILSGSKSYGQETLKVVFRGADDGGNPKEQLTTYIKDPSWELEVNEFANCVLKDQPIVYGTSADALSSMKIVYGIYCADEKWKNKFNL
ncbi:MAG: Gfo/Idh/MocA family oxidoreductase [Bacteriovoracaceae bacterium]|nr:Gfo/Idh/MocA family oxidoreductase [Bacteriovoracaceae bacterium]